MLFSDGMLLALFFIWNILSPGVHWEQLISWDGLESFIKFSEGKKKVQVFLKIIMKFTMFNLLAQMFLKSVVTKDS